MDLQTRCHDPCAVLDDNGNSHGHSKADNIDIRYADRFVSGQRDLIVGLSANNNPSVSDPWNTAAAWMQYVPVPSPSSIWFFNLTGSTSTVNQTAGYDNTATLVKTEGAGSNLSGNLATRGWTLEGF